MRTILSTIAVVCMVLPVKANDLKIHIEHMNIDPSTTIIADNLDLLKIKTKDGSWYNMTGSVTIVKGPTRGDVPESFDASFRNSEVLTYPERDYIQANVQATRNDNNRNNEIRIYVHQDSRARGKVDKNNIKVNWKGSDVGELDGKLSNVTVIYQKSSILITGTMQKGSYTLGVSVAITHGGRLI
ncbi:MAG: hypothetical protein WBM98_12915 [Maribacter sp.]|uniref:hypothetical protein n=1 Tax=Maribacter sp. TaxID=1897614 RepID=UPI003C759364